MILLVRVQPLQYPVWQCSYIRQSLGVTLMAESSEVKAFYREASNQEGRSESERNRRRNSTLLWSPSHLCSVVMANILVEVTGVSTQGGTGGLKAAILERSLEKARKVCIPVRMILE
jgi:hypothetical protein